MPLWAWESLVVGVAFGVVVLLVKLGWLLCASLLYVVVLWIGVLCCWVKDVDVFFEMVGWNVVALL